MTPLHPLVALVVGRRKSLDLPQYVVADLARVSPEVLSTWERGTRPMLGSFCRLAGALGLRVAVVNPVSRETLTSDPDWLVPVLVAQREERGFSRNGIVFQRGVLSMTSVRAFESGQRRPLLPTACLYGEAIGLRLVLVFDRPGCCRCDPFLCRTDDSGEHCFDRSCPLCLHGCPAPEGECCNAEAATAARLPASRSG